MPLSGAGLAASLPAPSPCTHQHVHAVDGDGADELEADDADQQAGVLHGIRHGQDPRADITLQEVDQRLTAPEVMVSRNDS